MDAVRTAVMNNRFNAIVEEASAAIYRTAHTTFVKIVQDYQCAIATAEGEMFAYPMLSGVNVFVGSPLKPTLDAIGRENLKPGDIIITNDPFATDGLVTHLMDVTLLYPIFFDEKLIAIGWAFVHASDIGGAVPGSISPAFTEVFQEGLRVRPMKLYEGGVLNEAIKSIFQDNSRIPTELWGDIQAMISGLKSMDRRVSELCERYDRESVEEGMQDVINYAETKARAVIRTIRDGVYTFSDYLEGIHDGQLAYFSVTMTVKDSEIEVDFTGTDPQLAAAYNLVTGATTHPYIIQCLYAYILTVDPLTPRNSGILRAIHGHAPRGTVLNAVYPASGGSRAASATRAYDVILGCLNQALPEGLAAAGGGMSGVIVVSAPDPRTGRDRVNVVGTIDGGGGARRGVDGLDGSEVRYSQRSVPVEVIEIETVLVMRALRLVPDSRRAGRFASGAALEIEMENTSNRAVITVRNLNRFVFAPWGFKGERSVFWVRQSSILADPMSDRSARSRCWSSDRAIFSGSPVPQAGRSANLLSGMWRRSRARSKTACFPRSGPPTSMLSSSTGTVRSTRRRPQNIAANAQTESQTTLISASYASVRTRCGRSRHAGNWHRGR